MRKEFETQTLIFDGEVREQTRKARRLYEQRRSSFLHASAILAFVTLPLQPILGLTLTILPAGLSMFMAEQSLSEKYKIHNLSP